MLEHLEKPKPLLAVAQQDGDRQSNVCTVFLDPVPGLASTPSTLVLVPLVHPQHRFLCGFPKLGFPDLWNNQLGEGGGMIQDFPPLRLNGILIQDGRSSWDSISEGTRLHTLGSLSINIGRPMLWLSNHYNFKGTDKHMQLFHLQSCPFSQSKWNIAWVSKGSCWKLYRGWIVHQNASCCHFQNKTCQTSLP